MNNPAMSDGAALSGMAMLGKTAAALAFIILLILLASYLLKRFNLHRGLTGQQQMRVVSSIGVGQRERVVIVEVEDTWLVLGVGGGQVNKLHELDAPPEPPQRPAPPMEDSFANRFKSALKQNMTGKSGHNPPSSPKSQP